VAVRGHRPLPRGSNLVLDLRSPRRIHGALVDRFAPQHKKDRHDADDRVVYDTSSGNLYYDAGEFTLARLHYEAAALIAPGFSLVYFNLALVHFKLNDLTASLAALEIYRQLRQPDEEETEAINQLLKAMQDPQQSGR